MKIVLFVKSILNSCLEIIQPYDQLVMLGKIEALGKLLMKFDKEAASDGKVWKYLSMKKKSSMNKVFNRKDSIYWKNSFNWDK